MHFSDNKSVVKNPKHCFKKKHSNEEFKKKKRIVKGPIKMKDLQTIYILNTIKQESRSCVYFLFTKYIEKLLINQAKKKFFNGFLFPN